MSHDAPVSVADPKETRARADRRRMMFRIWIGASMVIAIVAGVFAPFAEYYGNAERWVAWFVPAMAFLLLLGVGWLAVYMFGRPRKA